MTWDTHAARISRRPLQVVELDLDWYDDISVSATNGDGSLCFRTPATTDQGAFSLTTRTRRWQTRDEKPLPGLGAVPCVLAVQIASEEIVLSDGLGRFGEVTIVLQDFVDDDRIEDPFYSDVSRAAVDHTASTYFRKLLARNPYLVGRELRVIEGWATDGVWHAADVIERTYVVRDVQGPSDGRITIRACSPIQLMGLNNKEVPTASAGQLLLAIDDDDTIAYIAPDYVASDYAASGHVRIGDEIMAFTRSDTQLTLTRGQYLTTADSHSDGDTIQQCVVYDGEDLTDIIYDLLVVQAEIPAAYIDTVGWAEEQSTWLASYSLSQILSEPEKILDIIQELLAISVSYMWWDDQNGLVRFKALRPANADAAAWNDAKHLLSPVRIERDLRERVSRCDVLFAVRSYVEDLEKPKTYRVRSVGRSVGSAETENKTRQVRELFARWFDINDSNLAERCTYQTATTLQNGRITYGLTVAAKDAGIAIGEIVSVTTKDIVDRNGTEATTRMLLTRRDMPKPGGEYEYRAELVPFSGRFAFMTDDSVGSSEFPDYDDATAGQRDPGAFMCNADGTNPYPPYVMG